MLRGWDAIVHQAKNWWSDMKTNHRIYTSLHNDGEIYVTAELYKECFGVQYRKAENILHAKLDHVMKAYVLLGSKQSIQALTNACSNYQKEFSADLSYDELINMNDAFLIARVIRAEQMQRTTHICALSVAIPN